MVGANTARSGYRLGLNHPGSRGSCQRHMSAPSMGEVRRQVGVVEPAGLRRHCNKVGLTISMGMSVHNWLNTPRQVQ